MRKVVANSTPLIILSNISKIEILKKLYETIYIPSGVFEEVNFTGNSKNYDFIKVVNIKNKEAKQFFPVSLHKGEIEVMILAKEINADLCIIDDYLARKHAKNLGLTVTGTLGVLVKAKEKNILKEVKPVMDEMLEKKFYIDKKLYNEILEICGEK
ncbi:MULTISPECIES: DUF3368 domain-containing protein [Thermoanaerobacter]|jgi:predicted nucleic acid-binding protein|uniref:Nucleic acid-binding protein contains PIN domain-like protein n=2 Tax=Thermoanaerobacter TaxID=1754 RepID=B0KAU5_THEP3|nr:MULTISPECIES: DUF3368 domain-containing protein [Thermoanaerobacter]ABY93716.1 nucleic acid-binding protein contains PIN domain-like protein [Thermoanaerobacter pseudethanolicus ATCC 33223]ADV78677.1 nucleic acid binding protein [Thermoanaerobacter brockii subsp. finnii Ako-1]HBW60400.1 DUF3368 domain-containing protein [Thermoanaerobacter sp.]